MQNLDQIRADNALIAAGLKDDPANSYPREKKCNSKAVDKLPALIVNNGLLAAAAFALKKASIDSKLVDAMDAVAWHLSDTRISRLSAQHRRTEPMLQHFCASQSITLRLATAEALAFLSYLKRFAKSED